MVLETMQLCIAPQKPFLAAAGSAAYGGYANNDARGGGCALCKRYNTRNPNAWKTHTPNNCKKYNNDGTTKTSEFGNGDSRAQHGKKSTFATRKKEAKSAKHKVKKTKR